MPPLVPESTNNNHTSCVLAPEHQRSCLGTTCWWKDKVHHHHPGYHSHHRALRGKIHTEVAQVGRFSPAGTPLHVASTNTPHPEVTSSAGLYLTQAREKGTQSNTPTCPHARSRGLGLNTDHPKNRHHGQAAPSTSSVEHTTPLQAACRSTRTER